jgi:hypothetical protein
LPWIVVSAYVDANADLTEAAGADGAAALLACVIQRRQEHRRKDCDHCSDDEQFNERKRIHVWGSSICHCVPERLDVGLQSRATQALPKQKGARFHALLVARNFRFRTGQLLKLREIWLWFVSSSR